jgi:N-acetylgalactosamine kinase
MAGDVVATVGRKFPDVLFAYQHEQLGTGHAAQIGVNALRRIGHTGPVMITMGDKVIEAAAVRRLRDEFARNSADLAFLSTPKGDDRTSGRVLADESGHVLAIVEAREIQRARILGKFDHMAKRSRSIDTSRLIELGLEHIRPEGKLATALGPLYPILHQSDRIQAGSLRDRLGPHPGTIGVASRRFTAEQAEKLSPTINTAVYLFRPEPLYEMIDRLSNDNAQGEYYLTELIALMGRPRTPGDSPRYKLHQVVLRDRHHVQAFNSPDELLSIEDWLRKRRRPRAKAAPRRPRDRRAFKPAEKWLALLDDFGPAARRRFGSIYGRDETVLQRRRKAIQQVLRLFARRYGRERPCCLVRAPGQLNLMGRHIDHRGGSVNVMAIDREVILAAGPRDDDVVRLVNTDRKHFKPKNFRISDLIEDLAWDDWLSYVNSAGVRELIRKDPGDWSNYIKAAVMRLQQRYTDVKMHGMDCAVGGNIPMGAGLSSSSALVVAAAEAAVAINRFDVTAFQLVDLCGQGEWFTGSRAAQSDHAAIRFGRRGSIAHVSFFPFEVSQPVQLPDEAAIVVADSHQKPSPEARNRINERFAACDLAMLLLRDRFGQYSHLLEYIRDINPQRLGVPLSQVYRMLIAVPERVTRAQIRQLVGKRHEEQLEQIFATHPEPEHYELRSAVLYGAAECARSRLAPSLLKDGDLEQFGLLMKISHDGDRVSRAAARVASGRSTGAASQQAFGDQYLLNRIADLASENPGQVGGAQMHMLPGRFGLATRRIDQMVDVACDVDGVYGAQLAGRGLGGCTMALVRPDRTAALKQNLSKRYYRPADLPSSVEVCCPVEGAGLLRL